MKRRIISSVINNFSLIKLSVLVVVFVAVLLESASSELAFQNVDLNFESLEAECSQFLKSGERLDLRVRSRGNEGPRLVKKESESVSLSEFEVPGNVEFEVQCLSRFPVDFKFHGLLANPPLSSRSTRFPNPVSGEKVSELCYQLTVVLKASPSATGTYECLSGESERKAVHLYVAGEESPHILTAGTEVKVYANREKVENEIRLPCYTTNRTVGLKLFQISKNFEPGVEITQNPGVKYDPSKGFLLSKYECGDVYECQEDGTEGHLRVEIKCWKESGNSTQKIEFQTNSTQFVCKGASEMSLVKCSNLVECELMKSCANIPESECSPVGFDFPCSRADKSCRAVKKEKSFRGRVSCRNDFEAISRQVFSDARGKPAYNIDFITGSNSMSNRVWINSFQMEEEDRRREMEFSLYETEKFQCNVSRLIGADNLQWIFLLSNGTRMPALVANETLEESKEIFSSTADISFNHSGIKGLICRAPKLYSEGWLEDEHIIRITEFRQLAFLHSSETEVRDSVIGDIENNWIECSATGTDLVPATWTKNGHEADRNHNLKSFSLKNHTWIYQLQMTHDKTEYGKQDVNRDIYACTVRDVLGQTLNKTFEIEWREKSLLPQFSIVVALLFLAFLGIMVVVLVVMKKRWTDKAIRKIKKEFEEGKKAEKDDDSGVEIEEGKGKKGESNHFLYQPYDKKFEIKNADKRMVREREIGSGNFGKVHLYTLTTGQHQGQQGQEEGLRVAVKELSDCPTTKQLEDFLNEIKLLQNVGEHPYVVKFIGAVTANVEKTLKPKIVLEFCELGDIKSYLNSLRETGQQWFEDELNPSGSGGGYQSFQVVQAAFGQTPAGSYQQAVAKIKTRQLFQWCYEIACGMEHLANLGIVHRDLAARNVLLTGNLTAKVADFGLAKDLQKTGKQYYTPLSAHKGEIPARWVALESLREYKFSTYSDVWSMGVTMWEIFNLCEFIPWNYVADQELIANLASKLEEGERLCKPKYANNEIYNVMYECWEGVKTNRPSFSELKDRIIEAAGGLSLTPGQSLYTETDSYSSTTEEELQSRDDNDGSGSLTTAMTTPSTARLTSTCSSDEVKLESEI